MEIAQEEVLTCVGMIMYERLRRVYVSLREEERACQVLAAVGVHALCRSFDMSVEKKQGISNLELLYQEISRAEKAKEHKREQKKLKKKKKKSEKKNSRVCERNETNGNEQHGSEDEELHEHHETMVRSTTSTIDDGDETLDMDEVEEEEEDEDEEEVGMKRKVLAAGQKSKDVVDEDAGVECDHLEEAHEDEDADDVSKHHKPHSDSGTTATIRNSMKPNTQQQKKKKQKQKQKLKTPQKKHASATTNNNNSNNGKNKEKSQKSDLSNSHGIHQSIAGVKNTNVTEMNDSTVTAITNPTKCNDCCHSSTSECPCESDIKDSGYGSEPLSHGNSRTSSVVSSPEDTSEGSEVSCSDGFCNHGHRQNSNNGVGSSHKCHLEDLDDDHHHHNHGSHHHEHNHDHYHDDDNHHNHKQSFEFSFGSDSCKFFQEDQFNTLSLQQMLVSFMMIFYTHANKCI